MSVQTDRKLKQLVVFYFPGVGKQIRASADYFLNWKRELRRSSVGNGILRKILTAVGKKSSIIINTKFDKSLKFHNNQ